MTDAGLEGQPAIIKQSQKIQFGHYQANGMMAAAKQAGANPREKASEVVNHLQSFSEAEGIGFEIAGPGFINITLTSKWLTQLLSEASLPKKPEVAAPAPSSWTTALRTLPKRCTSVT